MTSRIPLAETVTRPIYMFEEGRGDMRDLLGGKGAGLAAMTHLGLPVPPGFTITTEVCRQVQSLGGEFPDGLEAALWRAMASLEARLGKRFGDPHSPLLVSVRSGAKFSMPGMMDTILNLGLDDTTVEGLAAGTENPRFAWDAYRRFVAMFSNVVLDVKLHHFEQVLARFKQQAGVSADHELDLATLREVVAAYRKLVLDRTGTPFPADPREQLKLAIAAVFKSWNNPRAVAYRNHHGLPHDLGTAVNIQSMVFGNMGEDSGTGVAFTRNPSTGEPELYGEYLLNAQGEDVVAGLRTPRPLATLAETLPEVHAQFKAIATRLEQQVRDVQDLEFTIERGKLYMLQTRSAKRTTQAAVRIAVDMAREGLITREEAILRVDPRKLDDLLHPRVDPVAHMDRLAKGLPASPGAATGAIVFDADEAEKRGRGGEAVLLVRIETCPDDIHGMIQARGVLTCRGGMTSHAAVVARGMGKPCVAGCDALEIDLELGTLVVDGRTFRAGDILSIDGGSGEVFAGAVPLIAPELTEDFRTLMDWADSIRRLKVRTNSDTPRDSAKGRELGAEGIGLCRTEHMFMQAERLPVMQRMILAASKQERLAALAELLPFQREDFLGIFRAMEGLPVTIRLLDPPLHEFLPNLVELATEVAVLKATRPDDPSRASKEALLRKVQILHESNPMMGLRGCRLGLMYPEINEMQVRAIMEAACQLTRAGVVVKPEIMIPLVGHVNELARTREHLEAVAREVMERTDTTVPYLFGTMIEVPRAALTADQIAREAWFFSFGTNDLTQMTFGFSRDDAEGKFLMMYADEQILPANPFETLDRDGVVKLMKMAVDAGRATRPGLKLGICGEHGGDPTSVAIAHELGLDYVSCSPYRVPIARLAAAQAAISTPRP